MSEYRIVMGGAETLACQVNSLLAEGWVPLGAPISIERALLAQAMVRYGKAAGFSVGHV